MMILFPLVLPFFTPPVIWLCSVLGMIIGLSGFQFLFTLYILQWERAYRVKLRRFTVWLWDERDRKKIVEYGVRAEKS